jgi:hypothetical protein
VCIFRVGAAEDLDETKHISSEAFSPDIATVGEADEGGHLKAVQLLGWGLQSDDAVRGEASFCVQQHSAENHRENKPIMFSEILSAWRGLEHPDRMSSDVV